MKILHLVDSAGTYGAEKVILNLMDQHIRMGLRPLLGSIGLPDEGQKDIEGAAIRQGIPVRALRMRRWSCLGGIRTILSTIREQSIDIVHAHGYKPNVLLGFLPRFLRGVPLVTTLHGWCSTDGFSLLRLYEWLDARALAHLDGVAVVGARMLDHPRIRDRHLPLLRTIPNAVSVEHPATQAINTDDPIETYLRRSFTFGSFGRLSSEKGYPDLLKALMLLRKRNVHAQLLILGDGPDRNSLTQLIQDLNLTGAVLLPGFVAGAHRYLCRLGGYVQPSMTEGMPIAIIEALVAGVPIIATAVGDMPDMLGHGIAGELVPPGDATSLADAMERVFRDEDYRCRLAAAARQLSCRYSVKTMADAYLEFYQEAIAGARRRSSGLLHAPGHESASL